MHHLLALFKHMKVRERALGRISRTHRKLSSAGFMYSVWNAPATASFTVMRAWSGTQYEQMRCGQTLREHGLSSRQGLHKRTPQQACRNKMRDEMLRASSANHAPCHSCNR